jgi:hypothetical protein
MKARRVAKAGPTTYRPFVIGGEPEKSPQKSPEKTPKDQQDKPKEKKRSVRAPGHQQQPEAQELDQADQDSLSNEARLNEATGRAPTPWWWAAGSGTPNDQRAPTPHQAFRARATQQSTSTQTGLSAEAEAAMYGHRPAYVHWLYAQSLGFQGFSISLGELGQLALTTPHPVRESYAKLITVKELESARELFSELLAAPLSGAAACGPALELLPHDCTFSTAAELSFDASLTVGPTFEGDAIFCVLRQDSEGAAWAPLASNEGLVLNPLDMMGTVEVRSFGRLMVLWLKGLEYTDVLVQMLGDGLLASLASRGELLDAAFRASFRLGRSRRCGSFGAKMAPCRPLQCLR